MSVTAGARGALDQPAPVGRRTETERAAGWLLVSAAVELAVLAVTGILLLLFYRPSAASAWGLRSRQHYWLTTVGIVRLAHRWTARAMVVTLLAIAVVGVMLAVARRSRPAGRRHGVTAAAGIAAVVVGLFASFTGYLLPWDQLALWAVKVGTNMMGYRPVISGGSNVQYVLIGGSSISVSTLRWWLLVHVVGLPGVLVGLTGVIAWRVSGHRPRRHTSLES